MQELVTPGTRGRIIVARQNTAIIVCYICAKQVEKELMKRKYQRRDNKIKQQWSVDETNHLHKLWTMTQVQRSDSFQSFCGQHLETLVAIAKIILKH